MQHEVINIEKGSSLAHDAYIRLRKNKMAIIGLIILVFFILVALFTPWIAPYTYEGQNLDMGATPPSMAHWPRPKPSRRTEGRA